MHLFTHVWPWYPFRVHHRWATTQADVLCPLHHCNPIQKWACSTSPHHQPRPQWAWNSHTKQGCEHVDIDSMHFTAKTVNPAFPLFYFLYSIPQPSLAQIVASFPCEVFILPDLVHNVEVPHIHLQFFLFYFFVKNNVHFILWTHFTYIYIS